MKRKALECVHPRNAAHAKQGKEQNYVKNKLTEMM